ncbi:HNH endonuclease signature motif containing protein, partial [Mycobacterium sp. AT1]|uniref:HNH endonuclease signature motif containing protein n=1 Tax=Mycobacterium sp. AT1 TaxID=1961706 RepID=UPI001E325116
VGQRIMLHARDRGCTKPGCTVPGYGTQVHHTNGWAKNGQTNIDEVVFACGGDNRLAEEGWTVTVGPEGVQWIPPPQLDVGQARLNYLHHPERLLVDRGP